jgi:uncharacterized protein
MMRSNLKKTSTNNNGECPASQHKYWNAVQDPEIIAYLQLADDHLGAIGFTEHGFRHSSQVASAAFGILNQLSYDATEQELAWLAGYLHDLGNFICRTNHGQTGASMLYPILRRYIEEPRELGLVLSAIGNHEEQYGQAFNSTCAAVIIADKADVHRSRVRHYDPGKGDIHDDVNYAVTRSTLIVDSELRTITIDLEIDPQIATVMDYFEIFLSRMVMCKSAAKVLGCEFCLSANGVKLG